MRKLLLILFLLFPSLCFGQEAAVKALNPTGWWKSYHGNTVSSTSGTFQIIKDHSGYGWDLNTSVGTYPIVTRADSNENLVSTSEAIDTWQNSNTTVTADVLANPINGKVDAELVTASANNGFRYRSFSPFFTIGETFTTSVYVKQNTSNYAAVRFYDGSATTLFGYLRFSDGVCTHDVGAISCFSENVGGGWWRFGVTTPSLLFSASSGNILVCPANNNTSGYGCTSNNGQAAYFYGAQVRRGTLPGNYTSNNSSGYRLAGASGLPAIYFSAGASSIRGSAILSDLFATDAATIFAVVKVEGFVAGKVSWVISSVNGYVHIEIDENGKALYRNYSGGYQVLYADTPILNVGDIALIEARHEAGNIYIKVNNGTEYSMASGNTGGLNQAVQMGFTVAHQPHSLVELITFNTALSAANRTTVSDYLSWTLNDPWKHVEVTP